MLARTPIAERLVRPGLVVPLNPPTDHRLRVREAGEVLQPGEFLFKAAEEALDQPILLRRTACRILATADSQGASGRRAQQLVTQRFRGATVGQFAGNPR